MGGSSMLFTAASFGVILAVSANNQKNKALAEQPEQSEQPAAVETQPEDQPLI
jgi:cell division protein FtsW